jgi:hypothetical protein
MLGVPEIGRTIDRMRSERLIVLDDDRGGTRGWTTTLRHVDDAEAFG